jgi:oligopeptide transport system permease protein
MTTETSPEKRPDAASLVEEEGNSLWSDAWKRLRKNRLAVVSLFVLISISLVGLFAPWIASNLTHFSMSEGHTRVKLSPPGTMDVSKDHPTFDGNKAAFDVIDLDGDGYLTCVRGRAEKPTPAGIQVLKRYSPTLYEKSLVQLNAFYKQMPETRGLIAAMNSSFDCPELSIAYEVADRHFDFFFDDYDRVKGSAVPNPQTIQPDGYVTWREFPKTDADLKRKKFKGFGLTGATAFRMLDINRNNVIETWEITERSRLLRYDRNIVKALMKHHDTDRDFKISRSEYPGAPELHVFWLGTDDQGRDVLTRLVYGARISIKIALLATFVAFLIGVSFGAISGYFGGRIDFWMMRFVDVMYGLPYIFILILLLVMFGKSETNLFIALGAFFWLNLARVVRGQMISLKTREFVEAARAIGVSHFGIIFRHLLPNTIGPVVVYATLLVPGVILAEAFLSFLGLGVQPPTPSWGSMITEGAKQFQEYDWTMIWPGLVLTVTLFAMNFVGDGIRDAIDPKTQKE